MPVRTIGLSEDAYRRLEGVKRPGESFNDVVRRLTGAELLLKLAGTMDRGTAEKMKADIRAARKAEGRQMDHRARKWVR